MNRSDPSGLDDWYDAGGTICIISGTRTYVGGELAGETIGSITCLPPGPRGPSLTIPNGQGGAPVGPTGQTTGSGGYQGGAQEQPSINACVNDNKFSSMVRDVTGSSTLGTIAEFAEFGAPVSLGLDVHAYSLKTSRDFWRGGGKEYASGFNWAAKKVSKFVGSPRLLQYAKFVGDKVSVPTAVIGAFTLGYNGAIVAQCYMGVLK